MIRAKIIDIIRSVVGGTLRIDNLAEYKETYTVDDMTANTLVPYGLLAEIDNAVITHTAEVGDDDVYTLTVDELATINTYTRYPDFVALIDGTPFPDIQPTYNGTLGSFTSVTVQLHSDGAGLNVDETVIQFS